MRRWRLPGTVALRYRDYRLFWSGYVSEVAGQQMLAVAQGWLLYELSGSAVLLGVAGLARAIPATILTFIGGAVADKVDQRRLLIGIQVVQMTLLASLGTLTLLGGVQVWHLLVIVSASAAAQAFENPARQAIFPRLLPRSALMDAVATNSTVHPGTRFIGPALAGLLMAQIRGWTDSSFIGAATLFYLTAFGYVVNARLLYLIRLDARSDEKKHTSVLHDMGEGIRVIGQNPIFGALIAMTYCSQFFGWSFQSLFPIFAKDIFHGGEFELGLLYSALGMGSLVGATFASNLGTFGHRGWLILICFMVQSALLLLVSASSWFWLTVGILVVVGSGQAVFNVMAQSTLQYLVPNEYRGRVMGVWGMTNTAVQPLGQLQMGLIAGATSAPVAVTVGAIAMIAFGLIWAVRDQRLRGLTLTIQRDEGERPDQAEPVPTPIGRH